MIEELTPLKKIQRKIAGLYKLLEAADVVVGIAAEHSDNNIDSVVSPDRLWLFWDKWTPNDDNKLPEEEFGEKTFAELIRHSKHSEFDFKVYSPLLTSITEGLNALEDQCESEPKLLANAVNENIAEQIAKAKKGAAGIIRELFNFGGQNARKYDDETETVTIHKVNRRKDVLQVLAYQVIDDLEDLKMQVQDAVKQSLIEKGILPERDKDSVGKAQPREGFAI